MKIYLCESKLTGHREEYIKNLNKIQTSQRKILIKKDSKNSLIEIIYGYKLIKFFISDKKNITHLLDIDRLYKIPFFIENHKKIIGTLHFAPKSKIHEILLKNFSKNLSLIIVHSEFIKEQLNKIGISNVEVVDYPSFYNYSKIDSKNNLKEKYKIDKDKIVLTTLGGTRYDKGLDILLESFQYLSPEIKDKIILNIAGKEETYKSDFIDSKAKEYGINLMTNYGFIADEEFMENVMLTDIMIMPYRKIFGGNSGPMTEAVVNRIPCITPKELNIGKLTEKYNLGSTFECENPKDLARAIEEMITTKKEFFTTDYHKKLTVENFLKRHEEIYNQLKGEK